MVDRRTAQRARGVGRGIGRTRPRSSTACIRRPRSCTIRGTQTPAGTPTPITRTSGGPSPADQDVCLAAGVTHLKVATFNHQLVPGEERSQGREEPVDRVTRRAGRGEGGAPRGVGGHASDARQPSTAAASGKLPNRRLRAASETACRSSSATSMASLGNEIRYFVIASTPFSHSTNAPSLADAGGRSPHHCRTPPCGRRDVLRTTRGRRGAPRPPSRGLRRRRRAGAGRVLVPMVLAAAVGASRGPIRRCGPARSRRLDQQPGAW